MRYTILLVSAVLASILLGGCGSSDKDGGVSNDKPVGDTNSAASGGPKSVGGGGAQKMTLSPTPPAAK